MASHQAGAGFLNTSPARDSTETSTDAESISAIPYWTRPNAVCRWRMPEYGPQQGCYRFYDCPSHRTERIVSGVEETPSAWARQHRNAVCRWRRPQYGQQGCSRFYDCPSHRTERLDADVEDDSESDGESLLVPPAMDRNRSAVSGRYDDDARGLEVSGTALRDQSRRDNSSIAITTDPSRSSPQFAVTLEANNGAGPARFHPTPPLRSSSITNRIHPSSQQGHVQQSSSGTVLPRWQPDAEVTYCPICQAQFNIFVRKHHCRKCGRVVCNSCSPHRIIIPHQFIVRPPGSEVPLPQSLLVDALNGGFLGADGVSGGERVRLCNPCVPDPNTAPPQSPTTTAPAATAGISPRSQRSARHRSRSSLGGPAPPPLSRYGDFLFRGQGSEQYQQLYAAASRNVNMDSTPSRPGASSSRRRTTATHPPSLDQLLALGPSSSSLGALHYGTRHLVGPEASSSRQRAQIPRPQVAEEDECPICHLELPSRSLPNFENLREVHITDCIQSHSAYGSPRPLAAGHTPPAAPRRTGMYTYAATEKDCVDDAECTICLEEFVVGAPMARLECLCRFHRACISAWFVNHPGRCPVHQHDGFGY